jgi:hypothetical protein
MDNRYFKYNAPALMQDGRFITNYVESRIFEQLIRNVNNIDSAQEFKRFLQNNGDNILNKERAYHQQQNTSTVDGKCVPLSGVHTSCVNFPNSFYGSSCGCSCPKPKKQ